jgi:hypothetical protein
MIGQTKGSGRQKRQQREEGSLAGLEYHGIAGSSQDCQEAVLRLLQSRAAIARARIITSGNTHCLLLTTDIGDLIVVKSGFSTGYGGTGPACFSATLQLLHLHGVEIDEWIADFAIIDRVDQSSLTVADVEAITTGALVRPSRWPDYILERHQKQARDRTLWREFLPVVPFSIIDPRIMDLALKFWDNPDNILMQAYRRLEDLLRSRTGATEHGTKLFSRVFHGEKAVLTWPVQDENEKNGRALLFTGSYMAYRNPRAHRETLNSELLAEFLLLNQLYRLEREAVSVDIAVPSSQSGKQPSGSTGLPSF